MKKSTKIKKAISLFLAFILSVSCTVCAFAEDAEAPVMPSGWVTVSREVTYKIVPEQKGVYLISVEPMAAGENISPYCEVCDYEGYTVCWYYENNSSAIAFTAQAGETYYLSFSFDNYDDDSIKVPYKANLKYVGAPVSAEITKMPERTEYYLDYDYNFYVGDADKEIEVYTDPYDMEAEVAFASGDKCKMNYYDLFCVFEVETDFTEMTLRKSYNYDENTIFYLEIALKTNPVSSIEIVQTPDKMDYMFLQDGVMQIYSDYSGWTFYPNLETNGLKVRINYTDGTNEIVNLSSMDDLGYSTYYSKDVNGIAMCVWVNECDKSGTDTVYVSYLDRDTDFDININGINSFEEKVINSLASFLLRVKRMILRLIDIFE